MSIDLFYRHLWIEEKMQVERGRKGGVENEDIEKEELEREG